MSEPKLSKYAAKKARQLEMAQKTFSAINLAVQITNGTAKPPRTQPPPKPKTPQPEPRGLVADLGDAPAMCAARMREAEKLIREALEIARTMQDRAKRGRQAGEVFSLIGIIGALPDKAAYAARRAEGVPNKRGDANAD